MLSATVAVKSKCCFRAKILALLSTNGLQLCSLGRLRERPLMYKQQGGVSTVFTIAMQSINDELMP